MSGNTERLNTALSGRYRIERQLGTGGMATVYLAADLKHDRKVAVKVLKPELAAVLGAERFVVEIKTTASLQHPHILPLFDSGTASSHPERSEGSAFLYYVMPYVEGETIREKLKRETQLAIDEALRITGEVADALDYAHRHGVIHRDIKPENILLHEGRAMLADFGIALAIKEAGGDRLTETGLSLGTPNYMSPEQATGERAIDARSDIYSLAAVLYEMLSGEPPVHGATAQAIIAKLLVETPTSLRVARASVPVATDRAVMRALSKVPADRFESAAAFKEALVATPAAPATAPTTRILIGALAVIVLVAGAWLAVRPRSSAPAAADSATTLAVLPIENVGGDSLKAYLADGITTELASALRKTPGLQVVGDLSTARFKGTKIAPGDIAKQLGVHVLLTGRLQSQGGHIRLQEQLVDADGRLVWSGTFDGDDKDVFALQDKITSAITGELRLALTPAAVASGRAGRTQNSAAHDAYLRGQFEKNKLTEQGFKASIPHFQEATRLDPGYAQAWVGLAVAYDLLADAYEASHPYHVLAKDAARRAVQADSLLGEAHVLYGFEIAAANWDFPRGLAEMERGLAMNPGPDGLFMYSLFLCGSGSAMKGVDAAERLIAIDPLSPVAAEARAFALVQAARYTEALQADSAMKKLDASAVGYMDAIDGFALRELGKLDESVKAYEAYQKTIGQPHFGLAITYGRMGRKADAVAVARALEALEKKKWQDPTLIAMAWLAAGDRDRAMQWLEKAFQVKTFLLPVFMSWDTPYFRDIREDPRFIALRKRVVATKFAE